MAEQTEDGRRWGKRGIKKKEKKRVMKEKTKRMAALSFLGDDKGLDDDYDDGNGEDDANAKKSVDRARQMLPQNHQCPKNDNP